MTVQTPFEERCINTIRFLAVDAIQKASSGHPGLPMGAASMAYVLWTKHLRHNPLNPKWVNRDRFILSAGHGSMLLYALLHLTGYDVSLDEIKCFRQWGSKTPGHPECHITPGVEMTTGPLGQGISTAVGMAMAETHMGARFNRPGHTVIDHYTYVLASDGDLMEGVAAEACSLAGHLGLGKLIVLFDSNRISLAGSTELCFTEDVEKRFEAYGWHTQRVSDGDDLLSVDDAITSAKEETGKPSIIIMETIIGFGSPAKQGSFKVHGSPLGSDEVKAAKQHLGWGEDSDFSVPDDVREHFHTALGTGKDLESKWQQAFYRFSRSHPELADEFRRAVSGNLPQSWETALAEFKPEDKPRPTRKTSEAVLQLLAQQVPELVGGSADLNPSTLTWIKGGGDFQNPLSPHDGIQGAVGGPWGYEGRNIHFGVREHAMAAIASGMALHGGIIPYVSTFLMFSDYMRPAIRLACLSGLRVIYVFTHDSIGVGEDGPTHQPIEQIMSLRTIPNLTVIRPCDAAETVQAWKVALLRTNGPTALILTRQDVPTIAREKHAPPSLLEKGGYILWESSSRKPDAILISTGSEVQVALEAARTLSKKGHAIRVVSLPSWELFERQSPEYREHVLPVWVKVRIAVEAGVTLGWERYVGLDGAVVGMKGFGSSAPAQVVFEKFGITHGHVASTALSLLGKKKKP
ncbi:MAG: transketolase [Desulfomonilia bacterium]